MDAKQAKEKRKTSKPMIANKEIAFMNSLKNFFMLASIVSSIVS
jgi:hypothetical protein